MQEGQRRLARRCQGVFIILMYDQGTVFVLDNSDQVAFLEVFATEKLAFKDFVHKR